MAKAEFLRNLTTARNFFLHGDQRDRNSVYLTPSAVKGFDAREFTELADEVRDQLQRSVDQFRQIAKQTTAQQKATADQVTEATRAFSTILHHLARYFPHGGETNAIRQALQDVDFPVNVLTWDFELGADSTDDPAVWVWVVVDDDAPKQRNFHQITSEIAGKIRDAFFARGIHRWPFVHFRTASEQQGL